MVYEVRFYVDAPIIVGSPMHLDAILTAVHPAMHNLSYINRFSNKNEIVVAPLPLDSAKIKGIWVWCATAADYGPSPQFFYDKFDKRADAMDYHNIQKRLTPRTGPGRDRMETVYGVVCEYVRFLASATNKNDLSRICRRVKAVGGLRKMGYGRVKELTFTETSQSWKSCLVRNGMAVRNLPAVMIKTAEKTVKVQVTPPYWLPDNMVEGVREGTICSISSEVWLNEYHRN